ncbi:MAG TPA: hypothetical protein VIL35_02845 [Vicinamibacterales bacterium]
MSTRGPCPDSDALVSFLYDEFEPDARPTREEIARHVERCAVCAGELAALGGVRQQLSAWEAPEHELHLEVVPRPVGVGGWRARPMGWFGGLARGLPMAAAASLVLGTALGLARLDVRYDAAGLQIRTGWGHATEIPSPAAPDGEAAALRQQLSALQEELRQLKLTTSNTVAPASVVAANGGGGTVDEEALFRRLRQLIDASELRQQQNLQLRIAEITQDFELRRRADLVQIEQGFGKLDSQRQQMLEAIRNVSYGRPPER